MIFSSMLLFCFSCNTTKFNTKHSFSIAQKQYELQNELFPVADKYPRTLKNGKLVTTKLNDWTEGFFPGCLWYLFENNKQDQWKNMALKWTIPMEKLQYVTSHHDIGFLMYCSYGNAYRLTKEEKYKDVLVQSAKSLCTRFSEKTGCIKSWNYRESWDKKDKWYYPVIIDNMMNLELLYFATQVTGDKSYADVATKHAETTAINHFRPDFSSYHVVNYDPNNGQVLFRGTCQGYSDSSTWARGQAWAIYGFTMVYRFTKRKEFLDLAKNLADYWLNNSNMPKDGIPYWDFNAGYKGHLPANWANGRPAPQIQPRDASAAAITSSALFELSSYLNNDTRYYNAAVKILKSLSSPAYLAQPGENGNFILKHSVGSLPHGAEIDVPLVYADYYYLEAMNRYLNYKSLGDFLNKPFSK
jgi:chondroitin AC lyase